MAQFLGIGLAIASIGVPSHCNSGRSSGETPLRIPQQHQSQKKVTIIKVACTVPVRSELRGESCHSELRLLWVEAGQNHQFRKNKSMVHAANIDEIRLDYCSIRCISIIMLRPSSAGLHHAADFQSSCSDFQSYEPRPPEDSCLGSSAIEV